MVTIRKEQKCDADQVRNVNIKAFGQAEEANIVDALRETCRESVSLVALHEVKIVGHILFTPVVIEAKKETIGGMGLAPMSVLPGFQRRGIGSRLVRAGLDEIRGARFPFVIVLDTPRIIHGLDSFQPHVTKS